MKYKITYRYNVNFVVQCDTCIYNICCPIKNTLKQDRNNSCIFRLKHARHLLIMKEKLSISNSKLNIVPATSGI